MQTKNFPWLAGLNPNQLEAVTAGDGPAMVLAGAGSGKTRVIIFRIAYIISAKKVFPNKILALTFTNKAAEELKKRLKDILYNRGEAVWAGTFHSIFSRILRIEAEKIGFTSSYVIYDTSDQERLVKNVISSFGLSKKEYSSSSVLNRISLYKNRRISPLESGKLGKSYQQETISQIYGKYQNQLRQANAMDFDDLIIKPIELFEKHPDVCEKYRKQFRHILVDEYQDTNKAQYQLIKLLTGKESNVYVVGDEDQSIYRWRGADITNVLNFEKDFPDAKIYRLEQNYRSSGNILKAAGSVIRNNVKRIGKDLWTERNNGPKIKLAEPFNEIDEAKIVCKIIKDEASKNKRSWKQTAIFYRTHAQSRVIEDQLRISGIPYEIIGGIKFYERKEVKDILGYLHVIINTRDEVNLLRIINYPPRGIGKTTLQRLQAFAAKNNCTLFNCLGKTDQIDGIGERGKKSLKEFYDFIKKYQDLQKNIPKQFKMSELVSSLAEETGIAKIYKEEGTQESLTRFENIMELINAISEFENSHEKTTFTQFLEEIALYNHIDNWNDNSDAVSLMTLHSAKGLEFPLVILVGLEEGLFPLFRSDENEEDHLEEERRLFYVGLTRGEEQVYVSSAQSRTRHGETHRCIPSTFLNEINPETIEKYKTYIPGRKAAPVKRSGNFPESPFSKRREDGARFSKGTLVEHPSFGRGLILNSEGVGEDIKYSIEFPGAGIKKVFAKYANLVKIK